MLNCFFFLHISAKNRTIPVRLVVVDNGGTFLDATMEYISMMFVSIKTHSMVKNCAVNRVVTGLLIHELVYVHRTRVYLTVYVKVKKISKSSFEWTEDLSFVYSSMYENFGI